MKLKVIIIFLFIVLVNTTIPIIKADTGKSTVQAVCRATLKNGKIVEGIILIGGGGYQSNLDTNGFYFVEDNKFNSTDSAILFSLDFKSFNFAKGILIEKGSPNINYNFNSNTKIFYLYDKTSDKYYIDDKKINQKIIDKINKKILERTVVKNFKYELLDYIPIYPTLPDVVYLDAGGIVVDKRDRKKPLKIKIEDIIKFELLNNPPIRFIKDRKIKEENWEKKYEIPCGGLLVDWYDELNKSDNKEHKSEIQRYFKKWENRY